MKKENSIYVLLLDQGLLYLFMNVKIAKDGSIEVLFPNIKDSLGTAQTLQICQDKVWGDRIFEKCGIRRDEEGDGGKTLEIRGKRRLSARDGGANYQQS